MSNFNKNKKIMLAIIFALSLTSCDSSLVDKENKDKSIEEVLDEKAAAYDKENGKADADKQEVKESDLKASKDDETESEESSQNDDGIDAKNLDIDKWKGYIVDMGEFDQSILDKLNEDEITDLYKRAVSASKKTGYWDVKDYFFQELAKRYPDYSTKFPLDEIEATYNWMASKDDVTDKFADERAFLVDLGYDEKKIEETSDKDLEKYFKDAYKEKEDGYYNDYLSLVGDKNFKSNMEKEVEESKDSDIKKFREDPADYDRFREDLVNLYEFDPNKVDDITNDDIDLAFTRGNKKLEETGFGDIGLVINEIAKMYPGYSTMYPGN